MMVRTESIRNRCRRGVKLVVKKIRSSLKKIEMQRKKEIMNSVQKMGRELESTSHCQETGTMAIKYGKCSD